MPEPRQNAHGFEFRIFNKASSKLDETQTVPEKQILYILYPLPST